MVYEIRGVTYELWFEQIAIADFPIFSNWRNLGVVHCASKQLDGQLDFVSNPDILRLRIPVTGKKINGITYVYRTSVGFVAALSAIQHAGSVIVSHITAMLSRYTVLYAGTLHCKTMCRLPSIALVIEDEYRISFVTNDYWSCISTAYSPVVFHLLLTRRTLTIIRKPSMYPKFSLSQKNKILQYYTSNTLPTTEWWCTKWTEHQRQP